MRNLCIVPFYVMLIITVAMGNEKKFDELIRQNAIALKATSLGGFNGKTLAVLLNNKTNVAQTFTVPAGLIFDSKNNTEQDLLVVENQLIYLPAKTTRELLLNTVCCQAHNSSPRNGSGFRYAGMRDSNLTKIAQYIASNKLQGDAAQSAVWVLSDKSPIESISCRDTCKSRKLIKYLCDNYKMKAPSYNIDYHCGGNAAFSGIPVQIKSKMQYELENKGYATLLIQDAVGHNFIILWEDEFQKAGRYNRSFSFKTKELKPGTYYARLFINNKLKEEKEITF